MEKPLPNNEIAGIILAGRMQLFMQRERNEITNDEFCDGMQTIGAEEKQWEISLFNQRRESIEP